MQSSVIHISDWLDSSSLNKEGIVISDRSIDPAYMIYEIVRSPHIAGKFVRLMVSEYTRNLINTLAKVVIPDMFFLPYSVTTELQALYGTSKPVLIISDSFENFVNTRMPEILQNRPQNFKLLFFTQSKFLRSYLQNQMKQMSLLYPNGFQAFFEFSAPYVLPVPISWEEANVTMTPEQDAEYLIRREGERATRVGEEAEPIPSEVLSAPLETEIKGKGLVAKELIKSLQIGNYLYPPQLQQVLNLEKSQRPFEIVDDLVELGGWIDPAIVFRNPKAFLGPKFYELLNRIYKASVGRFVVYSRFKEHSGVFFLSTMMDIFKIPHILVTGDNNQRQRLQLYDEFNKSQAPKLVLLISVIPNVPIFNSNYLYLVEGIKPKQFEQLLSVIYLKSHYSMTNPTLSVVFFIAKRANGRYAGDSQSLNELFNILKTAVSAENVIKQSAVKMQAVQGQGVLMQF